MGGSPVWTEDDQAEALEYERWLLRHCSTCGTVPDEWLEQDRDEVGAPVFDEETGKPVMVPKNPPPYEAHSERCLGDAAIARHRQVLESQSQQGGSDLGGVRVFLRPLVVEQPDDEGD